MDPVIETSLRGALALLWAASALHKARDLGSFSTALADYRLLPAGLARSAALGLFAVELGLAPALLLAPLRSAALVACAALLAVYSAAIAVNLLRGRRHIDCGCMGPALRQPLSGWLIARNALAAFAALACLLPVSARPLVWVDGVSIAGSVALLAALYGSVNHLIANEPGLARLRS